MKLHLTAKHGSLVVDVQVDFLPGNSWPLANGETILQPLNRYTQMFSQRDLPIIFIRDWMHWKPDSPRPGRRRNIS